MNLEKIPLKLRKEYTGIFKKKPTTEIEASDDEIPTTWTDLSVILKEISTYI
jgi:hypothetical protein